MKRDPSMRRHKLCHASVCSCMVSSRRTVIFAAVLALTKLMVSLLMDAPIRAQDAVGVDVLPSKCCS